MPKLSNAKKLFTMIVVSVISVVALGLMPAVPGSSTLGAQKAHACAVNVYRVNRNKAPIYYESPQGYFFLRYKNAGDRVTGPQGVVFLLFRQVYLGDGDSRRAIMSDDDLDFVGCG